jgi:Na+/melibiose symporter-like transporter
MPMPTEAPPLGLRTKLLYAAGTMAFGIKDGGIAAFLMLYYNQVKGLAPSLVGAAIAIAVIFDAVVNPIIGQISDGWRSRLGRRHPFMYAAALPAAALYVLLWNPPAGWSHQALFGYIVVVTVLVRTCVTLFEVANQALAAELTTDYDERTRIFSLRVFFSTLGGAGMLMLTYLLFLKPTPEHPVGQLNPEGYQHYGLAAAAIMLAAMLLSALGTHDRIPYLRQLAPKAPRPVGETLRQMAATLTNASFLPILGASLCHAMAVGVGAAMYIYLYTFFWGLSAAQLSLLMIPSVGGAFLGVAVAPFFSRWIGKKRAAICLKLGTVAAFIIPIALRLAGCFPENGAAALLPLLLVFALLANTMGLSATMLAGSMVADIVEDNAVRTGHRAEGLLFSAQDFVAKAVSGAGVFISGLVLTFIAFPVGARPGHVDPQVVTKLGLVYMPVVGLLYGLAVVFLSMYRISRSTHEENVRRLGQAHEVAHAPGE